MKREPMIFTRTDVVGVPIDVGTLEVLSEDENLIREFVSRVLSEAALRPEDLPDGWYVRKSDHGNAGFEIELMSQHDSRVGTVSAWRGANSPPCLGAWEVDFSHVGQQGWGPMLYDVMMELLGPQGLMSDRTSVSDHALNVWTFYNDNRSDVTMVQLDNMENELTPEDDDNCSQSSATYHLDDEWMESPLSRKFVAHGTRTIDALKKMDRWKEI